MNFKGSVSFQKTMNQERVVPTVFSSSVSFLRIAAFEVFLSLELLSQAHGQYQYEKDTEM